MGLRVGCDSGGGCWVAVWCSMGVGQEIEAWDVVVVGFLVMRPKLYVLVLALFASLDI